MNLVLGIDGSTSLTGFALLKFNIDAALPGTGITLVRLWASGPETTKEWAMAHYGNTALGLRKSWGDVPAGHKEAMRWMHMASVGSGVLGETLYELGAVDGILLAYEAPYGAYATATGPLNRAVGGILESCRRWGMNRARRFEVMPVNTSKAKAACRINTFRPAGSTAAKLGEKAKVIEYVRQTLLPGTGLAEWFEGQEVPCQEAMADAAMIGWAGAHKLVTELRRAEAKKSVAKVKRSR